MNRRRYIYWATPLFVLLSCGQALHATLGLSGALAVAGVAAVVAWGVVWLRLYGMRRLRPEFAVLSILPYIIYFAAPHILPQAQEAGAVWQNLYALSWVASAAVLIASVRPAAGDSAAPQPRAAQDPVFWLMTPLICLSTGISFVRYYSTLFSI